MLAEPQPAVTVDGPLAKLRSLGEVAIVHDYLNQRGGAERVVLALSDIWPDAPIYTSLYRPDSTFPGYRRRDVRTSFVDRLPIDRGFRNLFPLYAPAFRGLGKIDADIVIASSSGWAHMARTSARALHVVYCHTPARWLYRRQVSVVGQNARQQAMARPALGLIRSVDHAAARRADLYIANSENVRRRIHATYGINAAVVHPPVDTDRFHPSPRGERLLVISRLLPYKHVDLIVRAATRAAIGLDVVGDGPLLPALREIAGTTVTLHGAVDDTAVLDLIQHCRAVCVAAEEDLGLVAIEAQAAGKPVIAYGRGGSLETVDEGRTGVFFHERSVDAVLTAVAVCEGLKTSPREIASWAQRFSRGAFLKGLAERLSSALEQRAPLPSKRPLARLIAVHPRSDAASGRGGATAKGPGDHKLTKRQALAGALAADADGEIKWHDGH